MNGSFRKNSRTAGSSEKKKGVCDTRARNTTMANQKKKTPARRKPLKVAKSKQKQKNNAAKATNTAKVIAALETQPKIVATRTKPSTRKDKEKTLQEKKLDNEKLEENYLEGQKPEEKKPDFGSVDEPEAEEAVMTCVLDPFQSLPWGHVIWQHVLPLLSVVDKFRLRAVNRHCRQVVQRDFDMALAIIPPPDILLTRTAWRIISWGNFCATKLKAPSEFLWENYSDPLFFKFADMVDILNKDLPLKSLDLSYSYVVPSYQLLKAVAEQCPELQELFLSVGRMIPNSEFLALTRYELPKLHTLDLSRNPHTIKLSTLRKLLKTQKSLRRLTLDSEQTPQFTTEAEVGSVEELADLWLTSDLQRLTLTRPYILPDGRRLCNYDRDRYVWRRMIDAEFLKRRGADGVRTNEFIYTRCFPIAVSARRPDRYIPEHELAAKGVSVTALACDCFTHFYGFP